ncbi:MAG: sn-glycerol-3-phosphate ABC transporter ATP-binding protein UgpC [Planctomycetes bacterium]|nr:sn-glycerol-3-phosphate ABC transporter ATP-binding protein UgpC [Planctomycetota bacterium]
MANVVLKHLDKKYPNGFHAVRDLNLDIADGEFVVLVGPSGCGKSTTLRMVAGLEEATGGEIYIGDRLVNDVAPGDRDIAMVFQNYALYPHMSVYQNMAFGLKMRRTPKKEIEKRVREAAEILSIESLLERRPRELSGGQRQRVALGRAIVREPKVFLFDEPLSNLDAKLRVQMRAEIARLHLRLKTTIIYVTHDQVEAMTLGDRIVLMNHGVIQQVDAPMEIYRRPANRFVASFIGSPAMNFVPGEVHEGVFRFAESNGTVAGVSDPGLRRDAGLTEASYSALDVGKDTPNGPAVLGVRPEDLLACDDGPRLGTVTLDVIEHMGHETIAHFALAGGEHMARLAADAGVQPGDRLALSIRPDTYHLFSADDGRRLN